MASLEMFTKNLSNQLEDILKQTHLMKIHNNVFEAL